MRHRNCLEKGALPVAAQAPQRLRRDSHITQGFNCSNKDPPSAMTYCCPFNSMTI
jgi:hypothetical protein